MRDEKQFAHDRLTDRFDDLMDDYDLGRRTDMLVDRFLGETLRGKLVLDAGCGVGGVTRALVAKGGRVIALDIGRRLAAETRALRVRGSGRNVGRDRLCLGHL